MGLPPASNERSEGADIQRSKYKPDGGDIGRGFVAFLALCALFVGAGFAIGYGACYLIFKLP